MQDAYADHLYRARQLGPCSPFRSALAWDIIPEEFATSRSVRAHSCNYGFVGFRGACGHWGGAARRDDPPIYPITISGANMHASCFVVGVLDPIIAATLVRNCLFCVVGCPHARDSLA